ncbi:MAG: hypothetical protein ACK2TX_13115 [Anaerolineales bacterium]
MSGKKKLRWAGVIFISLALLLAGCDMPERANPPTRTPTPTYKPPAGPDESAEQPQPVNPAQPEEGISPTDTPVPPTPSPTPTLTEEPVDFIVTAEGNSNCRTGPGTVFDQYGFLLDGETATAQARLADSTWLVVQLVDKPAPCWIAESLLAYSFDAALLPVMASPPTPTPALGSVSGILWHEICEFTGGQAGEPLVLGQGCVQYGPGPADFGPNQVKDSFESGWSGVTMRLGIGACPAIGSTTVVTNGSGAYSFSGLPAGTYCIYYNPLADGNDSILIPGGPTYPIRGSGGNQQTVELNPGENQGGVNFGWAWQFFN